jgi:tetratricopeptide (TPR) repeat protein
MRRTTTRTALLSLAFLAAFAAQAFGALDPSEATSLFHEGNAAYADGRYRDAADIYQRITESGFRNADVYYNLGNALWKSGDVGPAVVAYERSLRIEPGHTDALANLDFARENLVDRRTGAADGPLGETVERAYRRVTTGSVALAASILYIIAAAAVVLGLLRGAFQPFLVRTAVVAAVLSVALTAFAVYRAAGEDATPEAVVMTAEVGVRTGPGQDFVLEFRLHEGTKVLVRETRGEWSRIAVGGTDLTGWLPSAVVERI